MPQQVIPPPPTPSVSKDEARLSWDNYIEITRTTNGELQIVFEPRDFEALRMFFFPHDE